MDVPDKMTPEQAVEALEQIRHCGDPENGHSDADDVLLAVLRFLGQDEVVEAWKAIKPKWYA